MVLLFHQNYTYQFLETQMNDSLDNNTYIRQDTTLNNMNLVWELYYIYTATQEGTILADMPVFTCASYTNKPLCLHTNW
jgi:hypothetical protein